MPGAAERAIAVEHRSVVEELRSLAAGSDAPYASSSGFRFAFDSGVDRAVADVSAVALDCGVLLSAVQEQPLDPPPLSAPGVSSPAPVGAETGSVTVEGPDPVPAIGDGDDDGVATIDGAPGAGLSGRGDVAPDAGPGGSGVGIGGLAVGLDTLAAREKVELGCRALDRGWFEEAAELFLESATLVPTDPFPWFGAGLATSRFDPRTAADHLSRASRYLGPDDPAGAAYAAIVAAALLEEVGDARAARHLLQRRVEELHISCPAISLHLARLGPITSSHVAGALQVDPMLQIDITVLGLDPEGEAARERRERTEHELSRLAFSIGELRKVGGGVDREEPGSAAPAGETGTALARSELHLWNRIASCHDEIDRARARVEQREEARRVKEDEVGEVERLAELDLDHRVAVAFFASCVGAAAAMVLALLTGRLVAASAPSLAWPAGAATWLTVAGLLVVVALRFVEVVWPRRRFADSRRARASLPGLEWDVVALRAEEFEARRRFERARQDTELRIRRIIDHRSFVVPRRPVFLPVTGVAGEAKPGS